MAYRLGAGFRARSAGTRGLAWRVSHARNVIRRRRWTLFASIAASLSVLCLVAWPFVRAHLQAVAVLQLVSGKPVPKLVSALVAEPIRTEDSNFETASGMVRARLYLPAMHPNAPGLVVLHGVHYLGMDEPRLEAFAAAMASCGLRVLTPELPGIKDYHVGAESIQTIGESAMWFAQRTGGPVGVLGLSFSGGLALLAASDPEYRPSMKFVFAVGSQDSMARVAQYYRTGEDTRPNGSEEKLKPHEYGPLVLEYEYLDDFVPPKDVQAVRAVLRAHLYENKLAEDAALTKLNPAQRAEVTRLMDAGSPETQALLAAGTAKRVPEMACVSPHGRLKHLNVPVYLLHGEADNIIPSAETLWMAEELPPVSLKAVLVSPVISHLDFEGTRPGIWDQWKLADFFALVMRAAER